MTAGPAADSWNASVHSSEVDYTPLGAAVVIDSRRALTAAHVVQRDGVIREPLWLAFPKSDPAGDRRRVTSVVIAQPGIMDLALLTLDEDIPPGVRPARLLCPQPGSLTGRGWWAFGFPGGDALGDVSSGQVNAALGYGWIRLATGSADPLARGFSGAGLWSADYEAVVAVVGQAHTAGGGGRAITLYQADLCFPDQKLRILAEQWSAEQAGELALASWGWRLADDPEAGRHWRPRARGVSVDSQPGYLFRGRTAALTAITGWLERERPDRRVLVVTGSPGVGKSAVMGRIVTTADPGIRAVLPLSDDAVRAPAGSVACAVHVKGKTALEVAVEIARAASATLPESLDDFEPTMAAALDERRGRFNVLIDALDEATSPAQARAVITRIVLPLVDTCAARGAQVIVASRRRDDEGDLLSGFGTAARLVNLDDPAFFAPEDLTAYALANLRLNGEERAGNPYVGDHTAVPVAAAIAVRSGQNFLITGLVARAHGLHDTQPADLDRLTFPDSVEDALGAYLNRLPDVGPVSATAALTALAFAEAPGMDLDLWLTAISALNRAEPTAGQLSRFARSSAANFLIESSTPDAQAHVDRDSDGIPVFRLFHQALNDVLLTAQIRHSPRQADEDALTQAFLRVAEWQSWAAASSYLLRSLPGHAARAGKLDHLLADDDFLLYADLPRLVLEADRSPSPHVRSQVRLITLTPHAIAAPAATRAAMFSITAALIDLPPRYRANDRSMPYLAAWASSRPRADQALLTGHTGGVNAVCAFTFDRRTLLATGGDDGTVRIWDPTTSHPIANLTGHTSGIRTVCAFTANDRTLLATTGYDRTVRIWDPTTSHPIANLTGHTSGIRTVCAFTANDRTLLASAGYDRTIRIWDPTTSHPIANLTGHTGTVNAICAFTSDGRTLLATAGTDQIVRIWDPTTSHPIANLTGHTSGIRTVCAFTANGRTLLATSGEDRTIRIWDPTTGHPINNPLTGHTNWVLGICAFTANDRTLLATTSDDGTIRIWDPTTGHPINNPLTGHSWGVRAICAFTANDRTLLASAGYDRTIRIWDPTTSHPIANLTGHTGGVNAVCAFTANGRTLLASASYDGTVRIWDPTTSHPIANLTGHTGGVHTVCAFTANDRTLLATTGYDGTVRIWDPTTSHPIANLTGHTGGVNAVCAFTANGRTLLASASDDGTVRIWDPATAICEMIIPTHDPALSCTQADDLLVVGLETGILAIRLNPSPGRPSACPGASMAP
ncbi:trypsin-like peptidase domain-containing protein [Rhizohabitans arisaemae]|uniref:trypsin-like peptidase domain-containing protein n=1 Tax=Rhizohabitans arisaemae TaxID=2720610 RepID=UPI0024B0EBFD|nr:trypsin-like peptidase domain-containing protein [Rhizohabitans arisaemae]